MAFSNHAFDFPISACECVMFGKCAARIGCVANGVMPSASTPAHARRSFQRRKVRGRRSAMAAPMAGSVRSPAMWLAYPSPMR